MDLQDTQKTKMSLKNKELKTNYINNYFFYILPQEVYTQQNFLPVFEKNNIKIILHK